MFVIVETKSRGVKFKVSGWLGEQQLNFCSITATAVKKEMCTEGDKETETDLQRNRQR